MFYLYILLSNVCTTQSLRMRTSFGFRATPLTISTLSRLQYKMLSDSSYGRPRPPVVNIPIDKLDIQFARSSGAGGQNVNKLNTKAEIRFNVSTCDWLPEAVKGRLQELQTNRINKEGELVITSQEHRTQAKNRDVCMQKLKVMIEEAYVEPKERNMWEGIGEKGKQIRREEKSKRSEVKDSRKMKNFKDFD